MESSSIAPRLAIAFAATLVVLLSPRYDALRHQFVESPRDGRWIWVALNLLGFALLWQHTATLFALGGAGITTGALLAWVVACAWVAGTWLLALAPWRTWIHVVREHRFAFLGAALGALLTWVFSLVVQLAWRPMSEGTLYLVRPIVSLFIPETTYSADHRTIATPRLVVEIAPSCAGYEGIALVTIFLAAYAWLFRRQLRLPQALWLFPIAWAAIWLANVLRIAALILLGNFVSPAIAAGGFHSEAGWIAFALVSLGIVALSHRLHLFADERDVASRSAAAPLLAPLMALLAASMVTAAFTVDMPVLYPAVMLVTSLVLWRYRADYRNLLARPTWASAAIGVGVFVLWTALSSPHGPTPAPDAFQGWAEGLIVAWLVFRVVGSSLVVPIAEELAFRGYLLRKLVSRDFGQVPATRFTWLSFVGSSLLFGLLHNSWLAGTIAGAAFAGAVYLRGKVFDAIVAHAVANALIAAMVLAGGWWHLWG